MCWTWLVDSCNQSYSAKATHKEQHARGKDALPSPDRLLTDRGSYIAYLESQLERVSAACLTVTSFDERLEQAVSAIRCLEEKTLNLARLVAVTQQFAEQQEAAQRESAAEVLRRLCSVEARLEELEEPPRAAAWEAKLRAVSAQVDAKLAEVGAASEAGLAEAAGRLQAALEEGCHTAHLALEKRMGEAAGCVSVQHLCRPRSAAGNHGGGGSGNSGGSWQGGGGADEGGAGQPATSLLGHLRRKVDLGMVAAVVSIAGVATPAVFSLGTLSSMQAELKSGMEQQGNKLTALRQEVKGELTALRQEVKGELTALRQELRQDRLYSLALLCAWGTAMCLLAKRQ